MLRFIQKLYGFDTDMTIKDGIRLFNIVGCVYPDDDESYFIDSNVQERLSEIRCSNGSFYGDYETARHLYEQYCLKNNLTPVSEEELHRLRNENTHYETEEDLFIEEIE